jgi:hypothetical protein
MVGEDTLPEDRTAGNVWRVLIGVFLVVVGAFALLTAVGIGDREESTSTFSGVSTIVLDLDNASVDLEGGGDDVVVAKDVSLGLLGGSATEEQDGETLRVVLDCQPVLGFGCRGSYRLTVPADVEVTGGTANGAIGLENLAGGVDVASSNGRIEMERLTADVKVTTSNGAIEGIGLSTPQLSASSSNGSITLSFDVAPDSVSARTSNGEVEIVLPSDAPPYAVDASTSNGSVDTSIRTDPSATHTLDVDTSNGDVILRYR